jgi:CheY-like chemotaxis protein
MAATAGAQAFALAVSPQPDFIVLDIGFPDADGGDVLAKLKADTFTAHIPVRAWSDSKLTAGSRSLARAQ